MSTQSKDCCICLSSRDIATILFALRYFQANVDDASGVMRDSGHFVDEKPIVGRELDYLCQHINTTPVDLDPQELDATIRLAHRVLETFIEKPVPALSNIFGALGNLDAQTIIALHIKLSNYFEKVQP